MVEDRWVGTVRYHDYTPNTLDYDHELDAYVVALAHLYSPDRRFHLTLGVVVTEAQMIVHRPGLEQAIRQGRAVLDRLIEDHRRFAEQLSANAWRVYTLGGLRLR